MILYDEFSIGPDILDRVRRDAERVYVGKSKGRHSLTQDEINARLSREAQAGKRVLRLKGGDPFVFGRGGEEREYLRRHGVEVVSVPGITAGRGRALRLCRHSADPSRSRLVGHFRRSPATRGRAILRKPIAAGAGQS